jgi:hypothetical protein
MTESSSSKQDLTEVIASLENLRVSYQVLYYSEEGLFETKASEKAQAALDFYISVADEQNPTLKCLIRGSYGNFFYSCAAPITLRSLSEIVDKEDEIPPQIENTIRRALAIRIIKDLPFNSDSHGCII